MVKFKLNLTRILAIIVCFYSCIVMTGWIFDIDTFTRILPNQINMKFITAFAFFLCSIGLWLIDLAVEGKREIPQVILPVISLLILLIMTTLLAGGLFGVQTETSDSFFTDTSVKTVIPGMPAIPGMFAFVLVGISYILILFESPRLRQILLYFGIAIILLGLLASFGYLLQIPFLYYKFSSTSNAIALNTAILFVLLGIGLILVGRSQKK